jgi:hypothetical protein
VIPAHIVRNASTSVIIVAALALKPWYRICGPGQYSVIAKSWIPYCTGYDYAEGENNLQTRLRDARKKSGMTHIVGRCNHCGVEHSKSFVKEEYL